MSTYVISDCHFGDSGVTFRERNFLSVKEMDEYMISMWNSVVSEEDEVLMLGDFILSNDIDYILGVLGALNGRVKLVQGNHDPDSLIPLYRENGVIVYEYSILYNDFWILSHKPKYVSESMPYANIYGDIHNNPNYKDVSSRGFCVCAERLDYKPILFEEIQRKVIEANTVSRKVKV